ncbi:hypothetical protein [Chitinophaga sp. 212800010-3]|uniref:hypothetical protein n=1 Tax=unclassified Chitinophaga TaxID=2619133 RepID=UPI002DF64EF5|nr:hypothetical protein [Chitinophaga sp. 212800010-3]
MNIVSFIDQLKSVALTEQFIAQELPGVDLGLIEIYMRERVALDSEIMLFDAESISNELIMEIDGIKYENFFPLFEAREMVEAYVTEYNNKLNNLDIAKRMLDYWYQDA